MTDQLTIADGASWAQRQAAHLEALDLVAQAGRAVGRAELAAALGIRIGPHWRREAMQLRVDGGLWRAERAHQAARRHLERLAAGRVA